MQPEESDSERFSKNLLNWVTLVGTLAAALTTIVAVLFPDLGDGAKQLAYALAILLVAGSAGVFAYQRWRKARPAIVEPTQQLAPTAALRGLLPFEDGDQLRGRALDVQQLYTLVTSSTFRFGVLWGESGCGKTSLLRAGLVPALRQNGFLPLYIAKPTKEPRLSMRAALELVVDAAEDDPLINIKQRFAAVAPKGKKIVVIFDQFEEFFLINRTPRSRANFVKWLGESIDDPGFPVVFLVGIRSDFFAQLQNFAPYIDEPTSALTTYQLHNFDAEQARQILNASTKADGIQFESPLIDAVVNDLEAEEQIRPAELQIVATRLKHKNILNLNRYEVLGRAKGILSSYISEEIKHSPNEQAARLILRSMCSEGGDTKSPIDQSLEDVVRGMSGGPATADGTSASISPEQVKQILEQFVSARILIRNDDNKYNLIHDYLALHVHTATAGTETNTERTNRLLKRYTAEYREDPKTRVPFARVREIQKYASPDVKSGEQAQRLLRKSTRRFYTRVSSIIAVPLIVTLALQSFLINSYYLSLGALADGPNLQDRIVIRSGHPVWSFVPGFSHVVVETDFSAADLVNDEYQLEMTRKAEEIRREKLRGFWFTRSNGLQAWEEQITARLSPIPQAQTLRLLGRSDEAIEVLLAALTNEHTFEHQQIMIEIISLASVSPPEVIDALEIGLQKIVLDPEAKPDSRIAAAGTLVQIALTRPIIVTEEMMQELARMLISFDGDTWGLDEAFLILVKLGEIRPEVVTNDLLQELVTSVLNSTADSRVTTQAAVALARLAEVRPQAVTDTLLQQMVALVLESDINAETRAEISTILVEFAKVKPSIVNNDWLQELPTILLNPNIAYWTRGQIGTALVNLAKIQPQAINDDLVQELRSALLNPNLDNQSLGEISTVLVGLAEVKPAIVTDGWLRELQSALLDPTINSGRRYEISAVLVGLAEVRPAIITDDWVRELQSALLDPTISNESRSEISAVLVGLAEVKPAIVTDGWLRELQSALLDPTINSESRSEIVTTLVYLAGTRPQAVSSGLMQELRSALLNLNLDSESRSEIITAFVHLAEIRPQVVSTNLVQELRSALFNPNLDGKNWINIVTALVSLAEIRPQAVSNDLVQELRSALLNPNLDSENRSESITVLANLAEIRPQAVTDDMLQKLRSALLDPTIDSERRYEISTILMGLAEVKPAIVTDSWLRELQSTLLNPNVDDYMRSKATSDLIELGTIRPQAVTDNLLQELCNALLNPNLDDDSYKAALTVLGGLAEIKPQLISDKIFQLLWPVVIDPQVSNDKRMSIATVIYKLILANPKSASPAIPQVVNTLQDRSTDSTGRLIIMYSLYTLAVADKPVVGQISSEIQKLRGRSEPHLQFVGARLSEMMFLGDLARDIQVHRERMTLSMPKLEQLSKLESTTLAYTSTYLIDLSSLDLPELNDQTISDNHLQFAAAIALEKIKHIVQEDKRGPY